MALSIGTHVEWGFFDASGKFKIHGHGRVGTLAAGDVPTKAAIYRCAGWLKAGARRANENVLRVDVLTIDDVGSRIDRDAMALLAPAPTSIIETSPGNCQWQYEIRGGMAVDRYVALRASMKASPVWGISHAIAPSNLVRLPMGVNGKPGRENFYVLKVGGSRVKWDEAALVEAFGGIDARLSRAVPGMADRAPSEAALTALLGRLPNDGKAAYCDTYDAWIQFGMALWGATGGEALEAWEVWCAMQPQPEADPATKWDSFSGTGLGWGYLTMVEDLYGQGSRAPLAAVVFDDGEDVLAVANTPTANGGGGSVEALQRDVANLIVEQSGDRVRFNVTTGWWHLFSGIWRESPHPLGYRLAKRWADQHAAGLGKAARAAVSKSDFYSGVERILKADKRVAVTKADFDRDGWLLGTPGGTVDLTTGVLRGARAGDLISLCAGVTPAEGEDCPRWLKFVDWACTDPVLGKLDLGMRRTLQQWAGYCLTGDVSQEAVMFFWGGGANGKGTFIETLQAVMGSYFYMATKDLFMATKHGAHTEEIAALAGKRMVVADEVPTSARWNESLLKAVSGGGTMTARHLYRAVFTFPIQFKVTIIGNEKPMFQGAINEALKRRLHMAAFRMTAKPRDATLKAKLAAEGPGVLRWMLNGLADMRSAPGAGLFIADSMIAATDEYFNENDTLGLWLLECVAVQKGASTTVSEAFSSWDAYRGSEGGGRAFDHPRTFRAEMIRRGYVWKKTKYANVFNDIVLKSKSSVF